MGILRTLLALAVVLAHSAGTHGQVMTGGQASVQCFYLISGYLISYVLMNNKKYADAGPFYVNRALRIYPVYLVVVLLSIAPSILANPSFMQVYHEAPIGVSIWLAISNVILFGQDWIMFLGIHGGHFSLAHIVSDSDIPFYHGLLLPQAWTLGVELSFYLLAPFIVRNRARLIGLCAASFVLRIVLLVQGIGMNDPWTYRFFPTELGLFLLGALSQQFLTPAFKKISLKVPSIPTVGTCLILAFTVVFSLIPLPFGWRLPIYLATAAVMLPFTFLFQNRYRFDRSIGDLSYPIYIGHMLVIRILKVILPKLHIESEVIGALLNIAGAIVFAILLNEFVAKRFDKMRSRVRSGADPKPAPHEVVEVATESA